MRQTYRVLALLVCLGVLVQAAAVAFAWFDVISAIDDGTVFDENSEGNAGHALHAITGMMIIPVLSLLLLIVSFFARVPGGVMWAAIVLGVTVLQVILAFVAFGAPVVGALHGVNALVLFGVAFTAAQKAAAVGVAERAPVAAA
jgi:hypothetical protein